MSESRVDTKPTIGQIEACIATLLSDEAKIFRKTYEMVVAADPVLARDFRLALDRLCTLIDEGTE